MTGGTVGEVVNSNAEAFAPGDIVVGSGGWQEYAVLRASEARKVDPEVAPISTALGVLGMPGQTAYVGLRGSADPRPARPWSWRQRRGRSLAGRPDRQGQGVPCRRHRRFQGQVRLCDGQSFGFDACLDHHAADFASALRAACPDGVDIYWENVGGRVFETVFPLLNLSAGCRSAA